MKHKYRNIRCLRVIIMTLLLAYIWVSCQKDGVGIDPDKRYVTLSINLPSESTKSKALTFNDENYVDNIYLIIFNKDGTFKELAEGRSITDASTGGDVIKKFEATVPVGTYDIMVLVNAEDEILASTKFVDGSTRSDIIGDLLFVRNNEWPSESTDHINNGGFPMWGVESDAVINSDGTTNFDGSTIPVIRSLVRIDVVVPQAVYNKWGNLVNVRLYNRYMSGQIIPNDGTVDFHSSYLGGFEVSGPSIPSTAQKELNPLLYEVDAAATNAEKNIMVATIYTFESEAGSFGSILDNTCLVLAIGQKNEDNSGGAVRLPDPEIPDQVGVLTSTRSVTDETWYYRVDFTDDGTSRGTYMPLLRNHTYEVKVKEIINHGFNTPGDAYRSESYNDISYEIIAFQNGEEVEGEIGNTYRLDISSTDVWVEGNRSETITIKSTHPNGWTAQLSDSPDQITTWGSYWLSATPLTGAQNQSVTVTITGSGNIYGTAYIHVTSDNMTNVIKVTRWSQGV